MGPAWWKVSKERKAWAGGSGSARSAEEARVRAGGASLLAAAEARAGACCTLDTVLSCYGLSVPTRSSRWPPWKQTSELGGRACRTEGVGSPGLSLPARVGTFINSRSETGSWSAAQTAAPGLLLPCPGLCGNPGAVRLLPRRPGSSCLILPSLGLGPGAEGESGGGGGAARFFEIKCVAGLTRLQTSPWMNLYTF